MNNMTGEQLIAATRVAAKFESTATAQLLNELATRLDCSLAALRQKGERCDALAGENAALKRIPQTNSVAMLLALDAFRSGSLPDVGLQKAFESLIYHRETPATDAFIAEQMAIGLEKFATWKESVAKAYHEASPGCVGESEACYAEREAIYFAQQLRAGEMLP